MQIAEVIFKIIIYIIIFFNLLIIYKFIKEKFHKKSNVLISNFDYVSFIVNQITIGKKYGYEFIDLDRGILAKDPGNGPEEQAEKYNWHYNKEWYSIRSHIESLGFHMFYMPYSSYMKIKTNGDLDDSIMGGHTRIEFKKTVRTKPHELGCYD